MKLNEYITLIGDEAAGKIFGVPVRRIVSWRLGARSPRPAMAMKIESITKGRVTFREIYEGLHDSAAA